MLKKLKQKAGFTPAFTMIELIFVIVVIGILSAVAIPRLAASRDDAVLVKGKSQVAAIRSGIAMQKSKALLQGENTGLYNSRFRLKRLDDINATTTPTYNQSDQRLFNFGDNNSSNVLEYPIYSKVNKDGYWVKTADNKYELTISNKSVEFIYYPNSGIFDCNRSVSDAVIKQNCKDLTE